MAGAIRRFPFLADAEVDPPRLPPRRDDARRQPARSGPLPGVARLLGRGRPVAQRLRRRGGIGRAMAGWITTGDPGVDVGPYRAWRFADTYRDPVFAAGLARETYSRLLPPALSVRRRPGRPAAPAVRRSTAASRRPARSSARRPAGSGPTTTIRGGRGDGPAATRPPGAGPSRPGSSGSSPRAGRSASGPGIIDLTLVRQDRRRGSRRARPAPAGRRQRHRPAGRQPSSTASSFDDRGGIVADVTVTPPRRGSLPGRDRCRVRGQRPGLAAGPCSSRATRRSRSAT